MYLRKLYIKLESYILYNKCNGVEEILRCFTQQ